MGALRTLLYVPGHRERMVDRALGPGGSAATGADAVILDLEDAVPEPEKPAARALVARVLRGSPSGPPLRLVRVNGLGSPAHDEDLAQVVGPGLDGVVLPKTGSGDDVRFLIDCIDRLAPDAAGNIQVLPLIESALGVERAFEIASASPRVLGLMFGAEDYALDLGLSDDRSGGARDFVYARSAIVNAAIAADRPAIDGVWTSVEDLDGLAKEATQARRLGFRGKSLIHPSHLDIVNATFRPTADEVAQATRIVEAYEAAEREGSGATTLDGRMIDRPVVERARRTLAWDIQDG